MKNKPDAGAATGGQITLSVDALIPVGGFEGSRLFRRGEPLPFKTPGDVPEPLKPFIAVDEPDEAQGPPGIRFEPNRIYNVDDRGAIITRHGRREAARLAGDDRLQQVAEEEAIAAGTLDAETEAALRDAHDVAIGLEIKQLEIRERDRAAAIEAAQQKDDAEQKPAATLYVKRGAVWRQAGEAKLRPGEQVFMKEPSGAWAVVGTVNSTGQAPRVPEIL